MSKNFLVENIGFEPMASCLQSRRSNQLSYETLKGKKLKKKIELETDIKYLLKKRDIPATPSGTATLLRLSPSYLFYPRQFLAVTDFRYPKLPWLDGRCVQGPGTYSPYHG